MGTTRRVLAAPNSSLRERDERTTTAAGAPLVVVTEHESPLLPSKTWRTPTVAPVFPISSLTWRKAMALARSPTSRCSDVGEAAAGDARQLCAAQRDYQLKSANSQPSLSETAAPPPSKPKLYRRLGRESCADFQRVALRGLGRAPPSIPAPPISDMKAWFAEYGKPRLTARLVSRRAPTWKPGPAKPGPKPTPNGGPIPNLISPVTLYRTLPCAGYRTESQRAPTSRKPGATDITKAVRMLPAACSSERLTL